ncbi:MAG: hypothetical protein F4Z04_12625 [Acidobacteria bacterium]|nr:hypothetical protein [Acidobacteriota bacterium]
MTGRYVAVFVIALASVAIAPAAAAQPAGEWSVPRTPDGHPDLQGVWANNNATPLERPAAWAGKSSLTDEELAAFRAAAADVTASGQDAVFGDQLALAALAGVTDVDSYDPATGNYNQFWLVERDFDNRTSLIVDPPDGRIPPRTPAAERAGRGQPPPPIAEKADSWADRPLSERCITYGVPSLFAGYNSYYQIFQSRDHVVVLMEMIHDARVIPIDGTPHPNGQIRQLHGDSRGRWEGDTLVVETRNYSRLGAFWGASEDLVVVERFTRAAPDTIHYEVTFHDETTWTRPWTVMIPLRRSPDPLFEYACHEGNLGMEGILAGYRAEERAATGEAR